MINLRSAYLSYVFPLLFLLSIFLNSYLNSQFHSLVLYKNGLEQQVKELNHHVQLQKGSVVTVTPKPTRVIIGVGTRSAQTFREFLSKNSLSEEMKQGKNKYFFGIFLYFAEYVV